MDILFPRLPHELRLDETRLRAQIESLYHEWHTEKVATEETFKIENVRFEHDPMWRHRFFSIQSAHDGNHWVWKATKVFWLATGASI